MTATLGLAQQLIACHSPTPQDGGCMEIIAARLIPLGFEPIVLEFGEGDVGNHAKVKNLWLKRQGSSAEAKTLVFAGHTDVVPTGPLDQWTTPPFEPTVRDGKLFGRGAADMKTSIAAFVVAVEAFLTICPQPAHSLALLLTSDEEGPSINGTVKVCEWLRARGERLDYCIVGEPTSIELCGDMIKNGRRGSLSGRLTMKGVQGHIAYPQLARNPIHLLAPLLAQLTATEWDTGNEYFPATSFQVSNIHAGTGATNVIPGDCVVDFNFRFCTESTSDGLQARFHKALQAHGLASPADYGLQWTLGGQPFLTPVGTLVAAAKEAIKAVGGIDTVLSTTGGTSDGRFISQICEQVIELGPTNASIHKINEYVPLADLEPLKNIYLGVIERLAR
ncbi:MAG: succinyl-diaminopimelate desuccinylase [Cytophagales bacterium]|nr:succinyl-diaminopimelate desuccinylase [Cytophagales bacterium]